MPFRFILIRILCLLLFSHGVWAGEQLSASPYLDAHAEDLVRWQAWGQASLQQARQQNKLVLVSSGYLACRYCHVMGKESFNDREIAAFINTHFIPILVDREMNPVLDAQLLKFMEVMQQPQGWPLQIILTPDGDPLIGALYQPPGDFLSLLQRIQSRWREDSDNLAGLAQNATQAVIDDLSVSAFVIDDTLIDQFVQGLVQQSLLVADDDYGGFGDDAKYPMAPQLGALLRLYQLSGDRRLRELLLKTLDAMASGALYDALNGGFFRYTTTPDWQYPHYEKMLDSNSQLAGLYLQAAEIFNQPRYRTVAANTLDMLIRDFALAEGGFASSLAAVDASGRDGGAYLWSETQLRAHLNDNELAQLSGIWQRVLLNDDLYYLAVNANLDPKSPGYASIHNLLDRLRKLRADSKPVRDDKTVSAAQGLALSAFSRFAMQASEPVYADTAKRLYEFIIGRLWQSNALLHSNFGGAADLADYAYLADGLLAYSRLTKDEEAVQWCKKLVRIAWRKYYLDGFWRRLEQLEDLMPYTVYPVTLQDTQLPSPSATLIKTTLALGRRFDPELQRLAFQARRNADATMAESPFFYATQIVTLIDSHEPEQIN